MFRAQTKAGGYWLIFLAFVMLLGLGLDFITNERSFLGGGMLYQIGTIIYIGIFILTFLAGATVLLRKTEESRRKSKKESRR